MGRWTIDHPCWHHGSAWAVIVTLLILGSAVAWYKLEYVRPIEYIGHADEAAYAHMGRSLSQGRGLQVPYVSFYFHRYPPTIDRREDHWPPFMGLAIAPFHIWLGDATYVARLPSILIGSIGLPLATAALALALSRRAYVALVAGLLMMVQLDMFRYSLTTLSDVPQAMWLTLLAALLLGSVRQPWMHIPAGVVIALAYFTKGSQLILLPLYPLLALLVSGWLVLVRPWLYLGLLIGLLLIAPYWIGNWRAYGQPLHNTQNYVSAYYGIASWEQITYGVNWDRPLPTTSDRWTIYRDRYEKLLVANSENMLRFSLLGPSTNTQEWAKFGPPGAAVSNFFLDWQNSTRTSTTRWSRSAGIKPAWQPISQWRDPTVALTGILAVVLTPLILLSGAIWFAWQQGYTRMGGRSAESSRFHLRMYGPTPKSPTWPPLFRPILALLILLAANAAFLILLWSVNARFTFFALPILAVLACTALSRIIESPLMLWTASARRLLMLAGWFSLILCAAALVLGFSFASSLKDYHRRNASITAYPYVDQPATPNLGRWIASNLPASTVVMTRFPWQLTYHMPGRHAVATPYASPEQIFRVARYYGVTHYLADTNRPGMETYLQGNHPGFKPVPGAPAKLFALDYAHLPLPPEP